MDSRIYSLILTGASNKVRVQKKDTGRIVWVSPETLKTKSDQYEKIQEEEGEQPKTPQSSSITKEDQKKGKSILDSIRRPKGWRSWDDEPALKSSNTKKWVDQHLIHTRKGSAIIGVAHVPDLNDTKSLEMKVLSKNILPKVMQVAEKAIKDGKKVTFLAEGYAYGKEVDSEETYNEQHAVAKALHSKFGDKVTQDTWDDDPVNIFNPKSKIWDQLAKHVNGNKDYAQASIAVFNVGQGTSAEELKSAGILSPKAISLVKKRLGVDLNQDISEEDANKLFRISFPGDYGDPPNDISALGDFYNAIRQDRLLSKVKDIEGKGGVAIVTPGSSHAWSLKPVLDAGDTTKKVARVWMLRAIRHQMY